MLLLAVGIDALVRPRPHGMRSAAGLWLNIWMTLALFGLFLALCGAVVPAAALALAVPALLALVSNAKRAMLGEPLLFSDLALIGAIFRHPQFYLSAIRMGQRLTIALAGVSLIGILTVLVVPAPGPHLVGGGMLGLALAILAASVRRALACGLAAVPDAEADVFRHGLLPVLLLYWRRWRASENPPPAPVFTAVNTVTPDPTCEAPELIVIVQCESFADPSEVFRSQGKGETKLTSSELHLPGLAAARAHAFQWGNLMVSGFGAYTMRTEYGVLFGREEDALQFRRYDPFLTASGEVSYAMPARLSAADPTWHSLFLHPHDLRFYGRDRILPAGGFAQLVGEDSFAPPGPTEGRYVTDGAMAEEILVRARTVPAPTLLYAVTIENHGPWSPHESAKAPGSNGGETNLVNSYLHLVRRSDAMLTMLEEGLRALQRPALLVFFGDHRPSIPGASMPGGERHTPYVMLRMNAGGSIIAGRQSRKNLTPAGLHHAILQIALSR